MSVDSKMFCFLMYCFVFILEIVYGQDYWEERHFPQYLTQTLRLKEIPKRFEIKGDKAKIEFDKYIQNIDELAQRENVTVVYKVKVLVEKPHPKKSTKKAFSKKLKKYNVPLKKKNMKLSNFELSIRKLAEERGLIEQKAIEEKNTEETHFVVFSTKPPPLHKFKPIISRIRTNYTKIVKPVKNREIILTK